MQIGTQIPSNTKSRGYLQKKVMKIPCIPCMQAQSLDLPEEAVVNLDKVQGGKEGEKSAHAQGGDGFQAEERQPNGCSRIRKGRRPICRVLPPIRRVRPDHYDPELISFGLYDRGKKQNYLSDPIQYLHQMEKQGVQKRAEPLAEQGTDPDLHQQSQRDEEKEDHTKKRKKRNRMDQQRQKVVEEFMEIMGVDEETLCCQVVPHAELDDIIDMYDDGFLLKRERARRLLTFDAVFLVSFMLYMYSVCESTRGSIVHINWRNTGGIDFAALLEVFNELGVPCIGHMMRSDLWLLENQIPLHLLRNVLKMMYDVGFATTKRKLDNDDDAISKQHVDPNVAAEKALKDLVTVALANVLPQVPGDCSTSSVMLTRIGKVKFEDCEHLLECLYKTVLPLVDERPQFPGAQSNRTSINCIGTLLRCLPLIVKNAPVSEDPDDARAILPKHKPKAHLPPVSDLQKAGVNVVGDKLRGCTLKFEEASRIYQKATLSLPQLYIDDSTERILRNLVAYESTVSSAGDEHVLMSYLQCMNDLVNTEEDVRLLKLGKNPVIRLSFLGEDKDVAVMFNNLIQNCYFEHTPQSTELRKQVSECYKKKFRHLYTEFVETHCSKPWIVMSLFAATLLLFMTAIQTIFSLVG